MASKKADMTPQDWWQGLSSSQRKGIILLGTLELIFTTAALWDLAHRPARQVRGPKAFWVLASAIQPVGPVTYLALGRRTDSPQLG
jgi:hypothetical protein